MIEYKTLTPLPPAPGLCPICAHDHVPEQPHNRHSMYYQMAFRQEHGHWPTWADAMAHCTPEMQAAWIEALRGAGQWAETEEPTP